MTYYEITQFNNLQKQVEENRKTLVVLSQKEVVALEEAQLSERKYTTHIKIAAKKEAVEEDKVNCYECKYRDKVTGSAHSRCMHPEAGMDQASAYFMDITAAHHGVKNGWFSWPFNFDPVWLESCNGFTEKGV
tara:strand:- start:125 stop:523 length:399 start_codon:yes stop_codon:yes gene_type:complete